MSREFSGSVLRSKRIDRQWSQPDVASYFSYTQQHVSLWERDLRRPSVADLWKLAVLFGCEMDDFLTPIEDMPVPARTGGDVSSGVSPAPLGVR